MGAEVFWQDSGFYLCAVREIGVLYPPGFVLYLLLCKLWTLIFSFLDFTRAVHLFSAVCAAATAGAAAVAARELLRARGPLLRVTDGEPGPTEDAAAAAAGTLAATGYTFWLSGITAKGYSLYFLILALLLWRLIRASESGRPRDFTWVAALIGLAWQAHPSAALLGGALALFVWAHRRILGWKGIAWRAGLAAACALLPAALVPVLAARDPASAMDDPRNLGQWIDYLRGARFTDQAHAFGLAASRVASVSLYFWEEFLGVGILLLTTGLVRLARVNRRLLLGMAAWVIPVLTVTVLFTLEGQHDFWFVAAWIPLHLAGALGLRRLAGTLGRRAIPAVAMTGLAAGAWAGLANFRSLDQRDYRYAALLGRTLLDPLDPNAILVLRGDDATAICEYLQRVRGHRPDVAIVRLHFLEAGWYDRKLRRLHPDLREPDDAGMRRLLGASDRPELSAAAFAYAQAGTGRPVFFEAAPPASFVHSDYAFVPAGPLWKLVPKDAQTLDPAYWNLPMEPQMVSYRRARGQNLRLQEGRLVVRPEAYERRLVVPLLRARKHLAEWRLRGGAPEDGRRAAEICASILAIDPDYGREPDVALVHGRALLLAGRAPDAEKVLRELLSGHVPTAVRASALLHLGEALAAQGRADLAAPLFRQALDLPGLPPEMRKRIEDRLGP